MARRDDRSGKDARSGERDPVEEFEDEVTRVFDTAPPPTTALVPVKRVRLFERASHGMLPSGMASNEQLEAFRELRTRLQLMATGLSKSHFTTLIVPIAAGSGASFVARNLAAAFTLQDQSMALLVDCDFRTPTQHIVLDSHPDGEGLSDYLDHGFHAAVDHDFVISRLILPTGIPGLHLIPAGRCEAVLAGRPREYFSSTGMRTLMKRLGEEPCFVFLDGPVIAGSPDARILSDLADFVILVVGYGRSTNAAIVEAAGMFDRAKFAGVVFNERAAAGRPPRDRK